MALQPVPKQPEPSKHRAKGVDAALLRYFDEHTNENIYIEDLEKLTGFDHQQILSGISHLKQKDVPIFRIANGVYRMDSRSTSGELFELVGKSKDGRLIIQDEDGKLYLAVEV